MRLPMLKFGQDIDKKDVALSKYKGKVLLVVNVASRWCVSYLFFGLRTVACILLFMVKLAHFVYFWIFLSISF